MAAHGISISIGAGGLSVIEPSTIREGKGKSLLEAFDTYVAVDIETTGLDPSWDEIIEIGAIRVINGTAAKEYQSLVRPSNPIDTFITELTGITNEMLVNAPEITTVLPGFLEFGGNLPIIAHNANFDINFIYDACISM
jgi:DNA polymerase-3 subunit epsilon